ncbi:MAG: hypothetical protein EHM39_03450 [Chloroflexi bacterium]|nr:MAG: hypothetical protein EHM39_03450 [Chloroflexota bacterium]
MYNAWQHQIDGGDAAAVLWRHRRERLDMIKGLVGQFNIIGKAALSSLAPSLWRLGLVLLGLILGLIWAYQGAPVKFREAEPVHLADGYKDQWIKMTAVEFAQYGDENEAQRKLVNGGITPDMIQELINENQATSPQLAGQLQALLPIAQQNQPAAENQADKIESSFLNSLVLGPLGCIIGTIIIGILLALLFTFYWAVPIGKWAKPRAAAPGAVLPTGTASAAHTASVAAKRAAADQRTDFAAVGEVPPITQYMSTYIYGNDLYDDSFSIETPAGEFLGECGSGISETIGVGEPKKVTAVEVWLFDKNDIRTITSVLMSEHAYNDQALRTKLAPKGEAVLAAPNAITVLETQTLRLRVRIIDLQYGEGPLPPHSFFERLTVEIAAWPKDDLGEGTVPPDSSAAFGDTAELLNY